MAGIDKKQVDLDQVEEPLKEHPPSWDEVMKEKKIEQKTSPVVVEEVLIIENEASVEVLSAKERFYEALKKILYYLKMVAQSLATIADFILMLASLFILYVGCAILTHQLEASRVMYHKTFQNIGQTIVVIGCLNILVFCPFGIWGTWKTNRFLVKTHNYWLLINILAHLVLLMHMYFNFMYQDDAKRKEKFDIEFQKVYSSCTGYPNMYFIPKPDELPECCCSRPDPVDEKSPTGDSQIDDEKSKKECWPFESSENNTKIAWRYWNDCGNKQDYLKRMIRTIKDGYRYLWIFISIEVSSLFFGILSALCVAHTALELEILQLLREGPEEDFVKTKKPKREKKEMSLFKQVLVFFVIKRIFWIFLTFIFSISLIAIKGMTDTINVKLPPPAPPGTTVTLWDLIAGFFKMSALTLALIQSVFDEEEEDEITKMRRRRKRPKGRIQKAYWKCKRMVARRVLLVTLSILFVLSLFIWKLAKKKFIIHNVPAGFVKINVYSQLRLIQDSQNLENYQMKPDSVLSECHKGPKRPYTAPSVEFTLLNEILDVLFNC